MKHSPAPWSQHPYRNGQLQEVKSENGNFKAASIAIGSGETLIGEFTHFDSAAGYPSPTFEEMHANARLAIAAPELFEACCKACALIEGGYYDSPEDVIRNVSKARQILAHAIMKAQGEL